MPPTSSDAALLMAPCHLPPSPPTSTSSGESSYRTPAATPDPEVPEASQPSVDYPNPPNIPASGNDGAAQAAPSVKRGRKSNRKVKTGCSNCKIRRIKCDERRPHCSQCIKSKKACTGYPAPSRVAGAAAMDIRIAPKPQPPPSDPSTPLRPSPALPTEAVLPPGATGLLLRGHSVILPPRRAPRRRRLRPPPDAAALASATMMTTTTPTMYQPSHALALQHTESLYFDLFRVQTASELSGYFNSTFWTQRVLQECHFEPAIRHAVIALGALYKTLEQSCEPPPGCPPMPGAMSRIDAVMCHWQVAIRQYSEACNSIIYLREGISANSRSLLMASVLLTCFDSFIGDHKQAILQIQTGLGLLDRIQAEQHQPVPPSSSSSSPSSSPSPSSDTVEEDLVVIFTRLAIQAKSYDMAFHFPHPYVIQLGPSSPASPRASPSPGPSRIPERFASLLDARLASDRLCEMLLRCIEHLHVAKAEPTYTLPTPWLQYVATFQSQLDAWSRAFQHILDSRAAPATPPIERSGIAALKMFQINTNILFSMMFFGSEAQFDGYLPEFRDIVRLGREVIGNDGRPACAHASTYDHHSTRYIKPSFSADLGIVPPLFVVATKCRDPLTRRQAIQLLRSSARREGMWDSEMSARIGEWVMHMEESDDAFPLPLPADTPAAGPERRIPEHRRVMVQAVDFDLKGRFAEIKVGSRDIRWGSQDRRGKATRITW